MGYTYCVKSGTNISESTSGCISYGGIATFDTIELNTTTTTANLVIESYDVDDGKSDDEGNTCFVGNNKSEWDGVYIKGENESNWTFVGFLNGTKENWCHNEFDISDVLKNKSGKYQISVVSNDDGSKRRCTNRGKWCVPVKSCHVIIDDGESQVTLSNLTENDKNVSATITSVASGSYILQFNLKQLGKKRIVASCNVNFAIKENTPTVISGELAINTKFYLSWSSLPSGCYKLVATLSNSEHQIRKIKHIKYIHNTTQTNIISSIYDLSEESWTGNTSADKQRIATTCQTPIILGNISQIGSSTNSTFVDVYVDKLYVGSSKILPNTTDWTMQFGSANILDNSGSILSVGTHILTSIYTTLQNLSVNSNYTVGGNSISLNSNITLTKILNAPSISNMYVYLKNYFTGDTLSYSNVNNILGLSSNLSVSSSFSNGRLTLSVSGSATLADYAKIFSNIKYSTSNSNPTIYNSYPTRDILWQVSTNSSGSTNYSVVKTNSLSYIQKPFLLNNGNTITFYVNGGSVIINGGMIAYSTNNILSATVQITTNFNSSQDILSFNNNDNTIFGNITASYNSSNGILTLTSFNSTASLIQWQNVMTSISYNNSSSTPSTLQRTIVFIITDNKSLSSTSVSCNLNVSTTNPNNTSPKLTCGGNIIKTITRRVAYTVNPNIKIIGTSVKSATVALSNSSNSTLSFTNTSSTTFGNISASYSSSTLTLTSSGATATVLQWQNALSNVKHTYSRSSNYNGKITFQITDNNLKTNSLSNILVTYVDYMRITTTTQYTASTTPNYTIDMGSLNSVPQTTTYSDNAPQYNLIIDVPSQIYPQITKLENTIDLHQTDNRCPIISGTSAPNTILRVNITDDNEDYYVSSDLNCIWYHKCSKPLRNTVNFTSLDISNNLASSSYSVTIITNKSATTVSNIQISNDTGKSNVDFITAIANQTITGTLTDVLQSNEILYGSINNGADWINVTQYVTGTQVTWSNITLLTGFYDAPINNIMREIQFKVSNEAGDGIITTQYYLLLEPLIEPTITSLFYAASDIVRIIGTADASSIVTISYNLSGNNIQNNVQPDINGNWVFLSKQLVSGSYTFTISSSDPVTSRTANKTPSITAIIDTTLPIINNITLSSDTGKLQNDFITKTQTQNISAMINRSLYVNEYILGSANNGSTWTNMQNYISGTSINWTNISLIDGTSCIKFQAFNATNNSGGYITTQQYILDMTAPIISNNQITVDIKNMTLTLYFTETQSGFDTLSIPLISEFTINRTDVSQNVLNSPIISSCAFVNNTTLMIIFDNSELLNSDDNLEISYNGTSLKDVAGNLVNSFSNLSVFNPNVVTAMNDINSNIDAVNPIGNVISNDAGNSLYLINADKGSSLSNNPININIDSSSIYNPVSIIGDYGTLLLGSDGSYIYNIDYTNISIKSLTESNSLIDVFVYEVSDSVNTDTANLTITIKNIVPTSYTNSYSTSLNTPINITLSGPDNLNSNLTYHIVSNPSHGTISSLYGNTLVYTPNNYYSGPDSFSYKVHNNLLYSDPSTININIIYAMDDAINNIGVVNPVGNVLSNDIGNTLIVQKIQKGMTINSNASNINLYSTSLSNPTNISGNYGSLAIGSSGDYIYTVDYTNSNIISMTGNQTLNDIFSYRISDISTTDDAILSITIANIIPQSQNNSYTTILNHQFNISLYGNDYHDRNLTYIIVSNPSHGNITNLSGNNLTFTPNNYYTGSDSFTYKVYNGLLYSSTSTININIISAIDDTNNNINSINPVGNVLSNDYGLNIYLTNIQLGTKIDSNASGISRNSNSILDPTSINGNYGVLYIGSNGTYIYNINYSNNDVISLTGNSTLTENFSYRITDGLGNDDAILTITISSIIPQSQNNSYSTSMNQPFNLSLYGNDYQDRNLTYLIVSSPRFGDISNISGNIFTYTPNNYYSGQDSFTYKVYNGFLYSDISTINIMIIEANIDTNTNISAVNPVGNILSNDVGDNIRVNKIQKGNTINLDANNITQNTSSVLNPTIISGNYGQLSIGSNGTYIYTIDYTKQDILNLTGDQTIDEIFSYEITNNSATNNSTITITIANIMPQSQNNSYTTSLNKELNISLYGNDNNNNNLIFSIISSPSHGSLSTILGNNIIYSPNNNYVGTDSFIYKVYNGLLYSTGTISINIISAVDDFVNNMIMTNPSGNILNDDGGNNIYIKKVQKRISIDSDATIVSSNPTIINGDYGQLSVYSNGNYIYLIDYSNLDILNLANNDFLEEKFAYQIMDNNNSETSEAVLFIDIYNTIPESEDNTYTTTMNNPMNISLYGRDNQDRNLSYIIVSNPSRGIISHVTNNIFTYTPNNYYSGTDSFSYKVYNGLFYSATRSINVNIISANNDEINNINNINPVNPVGNVLSNDSGNNIVVKKIQKGININENAVNISAETSSILNPTIISGNYGNLSIGSNGTFIYTVDYTNSNIKILTNSETLTENFVYQMTDNNNTDNAILTITITNIIPKSSDKNYTCIIGQTISIGLSANDFKNSLMIYEIISYPIYGQLTQIDNNRMTYVSNNLYIGIDNFRYRAFNGLLYSEESNVNINNIELHGMICYIGKSKVLAQNKETCIISEVCVEHITPEKYLVYSSTQKQFVPVKVNCISGKTDKFTLIEKNSLNENKPSDDFYVTPNHPIFFENCEIKAKNIIGAKKVRLEKQLVYTLVTEKREALKINNIDVMCWEYDDFIKSYTNKKNAFWIEKIDENINVIKK